MKRERNIRARRNNGDSYIEYENREKVPNLQFNNYTMLHSESEDHVLTQ